MYSYEVSLEKIMYTNNTVMDHRVLRYHSMSCCIMTVIHKSFVEHNVIPRAFYVDVVSLYKRLIKGMSL